MSWRFASVLCAVGLIASLAPAHSAGASPGAKTQTNCEPGAWQSLSQRGAADGEVLAQPVLIYHEDGTSEWMCFFIVVRPNGETVLVDGTGDSYEDLDDFRAHNDLLSESDTMVVPRDMMHPNRSTDVELIEVSGHTPTNRWAWIPRAVGATVAVGIVAAITLVIRRRRAREPTVTPETTEQP